MGSLNNSSEKYTDCFQCVTGPLHCTYLHRFELINGLVNSLNIIMRVMEDEESHEVVTQA